MADSDEPAAGRNLVKAYPVRTALSRQLTNADCVVEIRTPVIPDGDGMKPETRQAIRRFVNEIKLAVAARCFPRLLDPFNDPFWDR